MIWYKTVPGKEAVGALNSEFNFQKNLSSLLESQIYECLLLREVTLSTRSAQHVSSFSNYIEQSALGISSAVMPPISQHCTCRLYLCNDVPSQSRSKHTWDLRCVYIPWDEWVKSRFDLWHDSVHADWLNVLLGNGKPMQYNMNDWLRCPKNSDAFKYSFRRLQWNF